MKKLLTIVRGSLHTIVYAVVAMAVFAYAAIHFSLVEMVVKHSLSDELAEQLGSRVTVDGDVEVDWLNQVVLNQVTFYDQHDDTLLYARRAMIAFDVLPLLSHHLVLNTCQLIDFDIRAWKASADSAANYQFFIDALTDTDPDSKPFIQQLDLNAILLRQGRITYDVLDKPQLSDSPIDPYHICIDKFSANVHVHDKQLLIRKLHCNEHNSALRADVCKLSLDIKQLLGTPAGQHRFLFSLNGFEISSDMVDGKIDVNGTSDAIDFDIHQLNLPDGHPRLKGVTDLYTSGKVRLSQFRGPLDSIYITADIHQLRLRADAIGQLHASGTAEGTPFDADVDCQANCQHGSLTAVAHIALLPCDADSSSLSQRTLRIDGHCKTDGFDLTHLAPASTALGLAALDMDFDIERKPSRPLRIGLDGDIARLDWRGHTYRGIKVDVRGDRHAFDGKVAFADTLGNVNASFDVNLSKQDPSYKIDGEIAHFNPNALHLTDVRLLDDLAFSGRVHADIKGNRWYDGQADVSVTELQINRGDEEMQLSPITLHSTKQGGHLTSPVAVVDYAQRRNDRQYQFKGEIPVINDLLNLLRVPVAMNREAYFDFRADSALHVKEALVDLPALDLQQGRAVAAILNVQSDQQDVLYPSLEFEALTQKHRLTGIVKGRVALSPLDILLEPASLLYNDDQLQLGGAHLVRTEEGDYVLEDFSVKGGHQMLAASGTLGHGGEKDFSIQLDNFELGQIFSNFQNNYLHFSGRATGNIVVADQPEPHLACDDLKIQNFAYIDTLLGDASMQIDYALARKAIDITCDVETDHKYQTHIDCGLKLGKHDTIDLRVHPDHLPLGFINNWTGHILQQFSGRVTGDVRLFGDLKRLQLAGHPFVDGRFTHQIIGAHFHLRDSVKLDHNLIHLDNAYIDDCHGHSLTANARITHDYLRNFGYDVNITLPDANQGFLVLDRQQAPGRIYWGQLYVKGFAHLKGSNGKHRFNLNVSPTDKSWFYLSPREQDINPDQAAYSFLTFRDKAELARLASIASGDNSIELPIHQTIAVDDDDRTDLQVDLQVNASEQCRVIVQLDPLSEDKLICRGNGDLSVRYDPRRDITLAGTYRITQGTYTMSMKGDLMSKEFQLQNTSNVRFNGVPSEAELSLDARYSIPSVNLSDLDESITTLGSLSRSSVPVDCNMSVTGQLSTPEVRFDLEVKNVSDDIQAYVHNIIGTQEMLNQEVLYLLIFSKFYTPQYAQSQSSHTGSELSSFASASITSQLNQLLSHVSNNFTMGTNFRTDKGDFTDMEMDLSLSTRLLGDRLLLNGNVGYRDPANRIGMGSSTSFIGDFDMEFLINNKGTVRAKAYSHYNERDYSINNALTTQGIGFILRHDFKNFRSLWPWLHKTQAKPADKTAE